MTRRADTVAIGDPRARERRVTSRKNADWWITPAWATEALLERETIPGPVWEPTAGCGAMVRPMQAAGLTVYGSDLHDRADGAYPSGVDFLIPGMGPEGIGIRSIVCNPPFSHATRFIERALEMDLPFVAFLCRIALLEGEERGEIFAKRPPSRVWVFSRRITFVAGAVKDTMTAEELANLRGAQGCAWYVWQRHHRGPVIGWIP